MSCRALGAKLTQIVVEGCLSAAVGMQLQGENRVAMEQMFAGCKMQVVSKARNRLHIEVPGVNHDLNVIPLAQL